MESIRRQYLLFSGILGFASMFSMSTYTPYLRGLGLTELEINLVNTTFFSTCLLFDALTGAWADRWGRKYSFLTGVSLTGAGFILYAHARSVEGCVAAELVAACGRVFANGALSSWMYSNLEILGASKQYRNTISSQADVQRAIAGLAGSIIGYRLYLHQQNLAWIAGGFIMLAIAGLAARCLHGDMLHDNKTNHLSVGTILHLGSKELRTHPELRMIALLSGTLAFCTQVPNMQWPKFFEPAVGKTVWLGVLGGCIPLFIATGNYWVGKGANPRQLKIAHVYTGVGIVVAATAGGTLAGLAPFCVHEICRGAIATLKRNCIQSEATDTLRATVVSLDSTVGHVGAATGLIISGYLTDHFGMTAAWTGSGTVLILASMAIRRR